MRLKQYQPIRRPSRNVHQEILKVIGASGGLKGIDAILESLLYEARRLTNAEAGSIFLVDGKRLRFRHIQNDALFEEGVISKEVYTDFTVPMDSNSIVGHVATSGEELVLEDVHRLPEDAPYRFMDDFDRRSGYRTCSLLAMPLRGQRGDLLGVIQLINAMDDDGRVIPFPKDRQSYLPLFSMNAAIAIERGIMTHELVLRMVKMAELRDPTETGAHVQRVGAMAAAIYRRWALNKNIDDNDRRRYEDLIRLAAMLHDVGKVGISDIILKKPGKLTSDEFRVMKWHTVFGARLFVNISSELDLMAQEIALYHHEKWCGGGYPGRIDDIHDPDTDLGASLKRREIPLSARLTAVADVFDALVSDRCYKPAWPWHKAVDVIRSGAGSHFDPAVVEAFLQVEDVCKAIQGRFPDVSAGRHASVEERIEEKK
ncbi:MAG: HD domain-containing protein [Magnetococcales bacterium]|nr:HD domain-containing protein [Magnetococcales bacterium]